MYPALGRRVISINEFSQHFTAIYIIMRLITYRHYRQASEALLVKGAKASSHFMETLYGISALKALGLLKTCSQHTGCFFRM
nr:MULTISPECIES: hypothetical protein [Yersinia]